MSQNFKVKQAAVLLLMVLLPALPNLIQAEQVPVGTWKTAQTIQPFFYQRFLPQELQAQIFSFTNPADQKTALLAGSLVMTGTTLAHTILFMTHDVNEAVLPADRILLFNSDPGRMKEDISIALPRPRAKDGANFLNYCRSIRTKI